MKKVLIAIGLCFTVSTLVLGQKSEEDYAPPSSSALSKDESSSPYGTNQFNSELVKNMVQFNLTTLIRGNYYLTYERALSKNYSFTVGGGRYFMVDMFGQVYSAIQNDGNSDNLASEVIANDNFKVDKSNFQYGLSGRAYLDNDTETRHYIECGLRFYDITYVNQDYNIINASTTSIDKINESNQQFFFNYGSVWVKGGGKFHFIHQYYIGAGIHHQVVDNVEYGSNSQYTKDGETRSSFSPSFLLGYKLGFGW